MVAVAGLIDLSYARTLWTTNKVEFGLLLATFLVTLQFSMVPGIVTGIILSILILLFKAANPHMAILGRVKGFDEYRNVKRFDDLETCSEVLVLRLDAPFVFVNIQTIKDKVLNEVQKRNSELKFVVLDAASLAHIDTTGVIGLRDLIQSLSEKKTSILFAEVIGPVRDAFYRNLLIEENQEQVFFLTTNDAVNYCISGIYEDSKQHLVTQRNT